MNILKKNKNDILTEITRSENHLERIKKLLDDKKNTTKKSREQTEN